MACSQWSNKQPWKRRPMLEGHLALAWGRVVTDAVQPPGRSRPFLNTRQAGHYLGLSVRHLERLRSHGGGPLFRRHGRFVVYHIKDLDAWSQASSSKVIHEP